MRCRDALVWSSVVVFGLSFGWISKSHAAANDQEPRPYTIRTTSRLVLLDVSVRDSSGGIVGDLTKENFTIYEDGKRQEITQFAHADTPVTVGLVVDESGSMRQKQAEVITAALAFIRGSNPQDEIFVINFNEKPRRGLPDLQLFSDNASELRDALWRGVPEGRTALYDAIEMALRQLDMGRQEKKTLVVVSDGGDNVSAHKLQDVMNDVRRSVATIYTIGIFDEEDPDRNPGVLKQIAKVSGGEAFFPKKLDEIGAICSDIAKDIRARYTIGYVPVSGDKASERHTKVIATSPSGQKLVVKARTSYLFAPEPEETGSP